MIAEWLDFEGKANFVLAIGKKGLIKGFIKPDYDRLVDSEGWVIRVWAEAYKGYKKEVLLKRACFKWKIWRESTRGLV